MSHEPIIFPETTLSEEQRRRAFRLAYLNGAIWALGNGLGSTSLIIYLVRQLGAAGLGIGIVLAVPHIVGVLRLSAPALVGRIGSRRDCCLLCYGISALLLAMISQLANPDRLGSPLVSLQLVTVLWCVYHLLEYIGTVLLWSWLGDICPTDIRGRFIGNRERYMLIARIAGMLAAGGFAWIWNEISSSKTSWISYAIPASLAAALMLTAILPLIRMPDPARRPGRTSTSLAPMFAPLRDARLLWLLGFGAWFSLANGLTQSAQYLFPIVVFSLPLLVRNVYTSGMRLGQAALAPSIGAYADAFGNRRVLIVSQLIVAMGPLFFVLAARLPATDYEHAPLLSWMPLPWWILAGAWITWIAYVGLNVGLPNLMLKLAGGGDKASYVAWYFAVTGVVYGISTIAGGALYAWLEATKPTWTIMSHTIDHHDLLFTAGFVLRATAVVWLLPIADGQSDLRTR